MICMICTKFGKLNNCVRASDLETYHGPVDFEYSSINSKISLRECAKKFSNRSEDLKDVEVSCNCNGKCNDKRCTCFAHGESNCNSHCHLKSKEINCTRRNH